MLGKKIIFPVFILGFSLVLSAMAEEINLALTDYAIIHRGNSEFRVLTKFDLPDDIADSTLTFAEFSIGITPQLTSESILSIECYPLTTYWDFGNVSWNNPWQNSGGDFEEDELTMFSTISDSSNLAYFDMTQTVKSWLNGTRDNFGLIFIIPEDVSSQFTVCGHPEMPENVYAIAKFVTVF
jgi:hypothetical protein